MTRHSVLPRRAFLRAAGIGIPAAFIPSVSVNGEKAGSTQPVPDLDAVSELLKSKEPSVWLFTGDSITHGAKHTAGYRSYSEIFEERLRWELGRSRDWVVNTGISGQTIRKILDDFDWRVAKFSPAVVAVMIGTNDCAGGAVPVPEFESQLHTFVEKVRAMGAIPVLQTPNPIVLGLSPERSSFPDYPPVIRRVAEARQAVLVDHHAYWQDRLKKFQNDVYKQWLNDRLHPNYKGHQQIARLIFKTFNIFNPDHPTCGGEYYEGEH